MSAKEMFEELGYECQEDDKYNNRFFESNLYIYHPLDIHTLILQTFLLHSFSSFLPNVKP